MSFINRSAIILRPKKPFLEWTQLDDKEGLAEPVFQKLCEEPSVYLVPDWEEPKEQGEILKEFWPALFEAMLGGWLRDKKLWPEDRTFKMFEEWFEVQTHTSVIDIYLDEAIEDIA